MVKVSNFDSTVEEFKDFFINTLKSDDFLAVLTKPPKSVVHFLPEEESREIIFVYKHKTTEVYNHKTDYVKPLSNESFDGNPLEAPFHDDTVNISGLEIENDNNSISPIPLNFARALLSRCNLKYKPSFPVWCFCDDKNETDKVFFLSTENREGWNIRCVASSLSSQNFDLDMLIQRHKNVLNPAMIKKSQFNSIYNIHTEYFCDGKDKIRLTTLIKLTWNTLMANPPLIESNLLTSEIITKVFIGKSEKGLAFFWNELLILNEVLKMIKAKDFTQFAQKIKPYITDIEELKNQINEPPIQKNDLQHFFKRRVSSKRSEETLSALLDSFMSYKSSYLDSTDLLWFLLLTCKSVEEISSCIQQVVELESTDKLKVGKVNISRVSLALSGQVAVFSSDVAEHFVEVGIEKLIKEIISVFTISGVLPLNSLKVPVHPNFSAVKKDWDKTAESWLVWISQVFCALELLANTQNILCLSSATMGHIAENVLGNLTSPNSCVKGVDWILENPYQEFKLVVPSQIISSHIKRDSDVWMVALESEIYDGDCYCKSIFTKSSQSPFPREMDVNEMTFNLNLSMNFDKTIDFSIMGNLDTKETFWSEMLVLKNKLN